MQYFTGIVANSAAELQRTIETLQSSASERPRYIMKAAPIHNLNVCHSGKSRSRPAKKQTTAVASHLPFCQRTFYVKSLAYWNRKTEK